MFISACFRTLLIISSLFLSRSRTCAYPNQREAEAETSKTLTKRGPDGASACDTFNRFALMPGRDGKLYEMQASKWSEVEGKCLNAWTIRYICMLAFDALVPEEVADNKFVIRHCRLPAYECRQFRETVWLEVHDRNITRVSAHCVDYDKLDDYDLAPKDDATCSSKKRFPRPAGSQKGPGPPLLQLSNQATTSKSGRSVNVDKLYFQVSTPDHPDVWHTIGETFGQGLATVVYTFVAASVIVKFCVALAPHGHLHPAYHFLAAGFIRDDDDEPFYQTMPSVLPNMTDSL